MTTTLKNRTLGVAFLAMLLLAVYMTYAVFTQKFTQFDRVALSAGTIGLQLPDRADVKIRGVIVGQVLETSTNGKTATITLGMNPDKIGGIPANVTAALLPKTLFGEKYVSLVVPKDPSSKALSAGDKITQTKLPIEVEKVLSDIYPLLRTVQPAELNYTLNALSTALEGRGDKLGESFEILNRYLIRLGPQVPQLIEDLRKLATVSDLYADVVPELAATLRNTVTTGKTLRGREQRLNAFLKSVTAVSGTTRSFLQTNGDNIVRLGQVTAPTAALLKRYSPEFPCLLNGIVNIAPKLGSAFRGYILHIDLIPLPNQARAYGARDVPVYGAKNGPYCGTLPNPPYSPGNVFSKIPDVNDGTGSNDSLRNLGPLPVPAQGRAATGFSSSPTVLVGGNAQEKAVMTSLTAPVLGKGADEVSDLTTLLFAPMARGSQVSMR